MKRERKPLRCRVVNGVLTIEIGINTLSWATLHADYVWRLAGMPQADHQKRFSINDDKEFARDVVREMNNEAEDGITPLSLFVDEMCKKAIEEGSIAFVDAEDSE